MYSGIMNEFTVQFGLKLRKIKVQKYMKENKNRLKYREYEKMVKRRVSSYEGG